MKFGVPAWLYNFTIDTHHTPHYAAGYLMKQVNPRIAMVTHVEYDEDLLGETVAGIRAHWDGLFMSGSPDVMVVNVTKEAVWGRMAVLPSFTGATVPNPRILLGLGDGPLPEVVPLPQPRMPREVQQEQYTRDVEIDLAEYYPPDVYREPLTKLPKDLNFSREELEAMLAAQPLRKDK